MTIRVQAVIDCPIERVFTEYMRPEFREQWDDNVLRAYWAKPDEPIQLGSQFHVVVRTMGQERDTLRTIVEYDPPVTMTYSTNTAGLQIISQQTFEAIDQQTRLTMHAHISGNGLLSILAWVIGQQLKGHMYEGLLCFKALVEAH